MRLIRKPELEAKVGFTERYLRDLESAGRFPKRIRPDPNGPAVAWIEQEVDDWILQRGEAREAA
jgi:prophage regulatory protein